MAASLPKDGYSREDNRWLGIGAEGVSELRATG